MLIYKATNKVTGKSYIGQTIGYLSRRKYQHIYAVIKQNSQLYFHNAIRKYDPNNFEWSTIEKCSSQSELDEMEFHYIKQYNSKTPNGYNLTDGEGNKSTGYKFTKEQCKVLSQRMSGKNNPNYGNGDKIRGNKNPAKRASVRKKISVAKTGLKRPDVAGYRAQCYLIVDLKTEKELIIKNLSKWVRDNPGYGRTGCKNIINGTWKQYKGLWIKKIE